VEYAHANINMVPGQEISCPKSLTAWYPDQLILITWLTQAADLHNEKCFPERTTVCGLLVFTTCAMQQNVKDVRFEMRQRDFI
jgi:hypothetical protein